MVPYKIKIISVGNKEYRLYGKDKIYIKKEGFRKLKQEEINQCIIKRERHPWLSYLYIRGGLNCVRFFNWLYDNNDNFNSFEIENFKVCGNRKFLKALKAIGNKEKRETKLAPDWKDILLDVIQSLDSKFYSLREIKEITNNYLLKKLKNIGLERLINTKKIDDVDNLARKLKNIELNTDIINSYQKKEGRYYRRYYCKTINQPPIPTEFFREIILITKNGEILPNVKNLIVKILLDYNQWTSFKELKDLIINSKKFKHSATRPHNIVMFLLELQSFEVLLSDKEAIDVKKRSYILNKSILPKYYKMNIKELHEKLKTVFKK